MTWVAQSASRSVSVVPESEYVATLASAAVNCDSSVIAWEGAQVLLRRAG